MKKYSIRTIKKYLEKCDSFGDAIYFCTEERLDKYVPRKKKKTETNQNNINISTNEKSISRSCRN